MEEVLEMTRLAGRSFGKSPDYFYGTSINSPGYEIADTRLALIDGKMAASLNILSREILIDGIAVPVGGVADVNCAEEHRRTGIATALLEDSINHIKKNGFLLSLLFADKHDFYGRLGWRIVPRPRYILDSSRPPFLVPARYHVENAELSAGIELLKKMSEWSSPEYCGAVLRTEEYWRGFGKWYPFRNPVAHVAFEKETPVAVCLIQTYGNAVRIMECRYEMGHAESPKNLLLSALELAAQTGAGEVTAVMPETHPIAVKIILLGGRRESKTNLMGKIIDLEGLMRRLSPVFEKRLQKAGIDNGDWGLEVQGVGTIGFKLKNGRLRVSRSGVAGEGFVSIEQGEFIMRLLGVSGFHGLKYKSLPAFFEAMLAPQDFVFWDADGF